MNKRPLPLFIGTFVLFLFLMAPAISSAAPTFTRPLHIGSKGSDVSALQQFLKDKGYFTYPSITGLYGTFTYKAVAAFQTANHLEAVGNVGPLTRGLLNTALAGGSSSATPATGGTSSTAGSTTPPATIPFPAPLPGYAPGQIIFIGGTSATTPATIPDTTAPSVSLTAPSNGASVGGSVSLTASASDNVAVAGVTFKVNGVTIGSEVTTPPYTVAWDTTATSSGSKTITATARDTSGNVTVSSSISVTVDNTPPVISSIATSTVNNTNATVTWSTNEAANSKVVYGTSLSYGAASSSALLLTSHSIVLSGLTASTTYHYAVVSTDAAGNAATSSDKTFTTQTGLLGVSLVGATQYSYTFPTNADFAYLQSKGVTFVKLIINSESLQSTLGNTSLNSTYLAAIKTAIAAPTHTTSAL